MNRLLELEKEVKGDRIYYRKRFGRLRPVKPTISRSFSQPVNYRVPGLVPVLKQPTSMTCWAAVTTMLISWRDNQSIGIGDALEGIDPKYINKFKANQGLSAAEKAPFLAAAGLIAETPINLTISGWEHMLRTYGPLWVTTDEQPGAGFAIHARVMTGIHGDGTPGGTFVKFIDPAGAREYDEKFSKFVKKYEEEVADTGRARIQIVHWPKDVKYSQPKGGPARDESKPAASLKPVLKLKQMVPNKDEVDVVGAITKRIERDTPEFKALVMNENPDIDFKDEERTGADRLMTSHLKEKLDALAELVKNEYPGKKLRVTEAWDENCEHKVNSLHYEGRAADITISDLDRKKLGRLGQLAVDAGFDWVCFEDLKHIHVSVRK